MTSDQSRRFTDREVALVLRRASEIEDTQGTEGAAGLSLEELQDIGREVGISADAIARAAASLGRSGVVPAALAGAPLVRKAVHAVQGRLNEEALGALIRHVDERADSAGSISQALGSVRWTASDRFRSMQVSITPAGAETRIQVVEKATPRFRHVVQLLPAAWGVMLAAPLAGALGTPGAGIVALLAAGGLVGGAIGRGVWSLLSSQSEARVSRLAAELSAEAFDAARRGLVEEGAPGE